MSLCVTGAAVVLPADTGAVRIVDEIPTPTRFSARELRRVSRLGRLALGAMDPAWRASGLRPTDRVGLVVGTALAELRDAATFLRQLHERGPGLAGPLHFQRSGHGAVAGELALLYGLTGYNLTITEGLNTGAAALFAAALALRAGRCEQVVCVAADAICAAVLQARDALDPRCRIGEASAAMVLERTGTASARGAEVLMELDVPVPGPVGAPLERVGLCGAVEMVRRALACPGAAILPHRERLGTDQTEGTEETEEILC